MCGSRRFFRKFQKVGRKRERAEANLSGGSVFGKGKGSPLTLARDQPPSKTSIIAHFRGLACMPVVVSSSCSHISNGGLVNNQIQKGNEINVGIPYSTNARLLASVLCQARVWVWWCASEVQFRSEPGSNLRSGPTRAWT